MNFTFNNHLTYTIGNKLFGYRENVYEKFVVSVGTIDIDQYRSSNWLNEQYRTAEIIKKDFGNEIAVMFSGGTDSEIVLRAFKHIGIIPRTIFIKFKGDYNIDDLVIAEKVANQLGIKLEVIEFDIFEFYNSGAAADFSKSIQCRQMAYLNVYNMIRKIQMPSVMGGELMLRRNSDINGSRWYYCFRENEDASAMRFSIKYNIPLVNEWFSYTPEMICYYLEHPGTQSLITERYNYKLASVSTKNSTLKSFMPEILNKTKTHGFEKLLGFNGETYRSLYLTHTKRLEPSLDGIFVDDLKKNLYGDLYDGS